MIRIATAGNTSRGVREIGGQSLTSSEGELIATFNSAFPRSFQVEVSDDGVAWQSLAL